MKRIRVLRNLGAGLPRLSEGQEVDVEDSDCQRLVDLGLAVLLRAVPPVADLIGVPPEEGSVEHATEKLKAYRARARRAKHQEQE